MLALRCYTDFWLSPFRVSLERICMNTGLQMVGKDGLRTTSRSFMKMFIKRELAVQFPWSELGDKRVSNTKVCFRHHDIRAVLDSK